MPFNLLYEPWIPAAGADGAPCEVGLVEALERAHELRWIDAEAPTVTAALHRLLLAFAHRVYGPEDEGAWARLWEAHRFPTDQLHAYAERYADRFDLFGERPFHQTPGIPAEKFGSAAQLTMYRAVGNNATLFDQTTDADRVELPPAEAARWLVTVQAFDSGGMKTPYQNDKSSERGLCNNFATVLVEGAWLKETLLLNMPVYAPAWGSPQGTREGDRPVWELDQPPGPEPVTKGPPPRGWTELLTWPSRRILLRPARHGSETRVDAAVIMPGTRLRADLAGAELMAAFWREVKRDQKGGKGRKGKQKVTLGPPRPVRLEELRGVWRHCRELLLPAPEMSARVRPRVLDHVADVAELGHIPADQVYTLRVFGQILDPRGGGSVHTWLQESVPAPVALLRANQHEPRLEQLLGFAVGLADDVGAALRDLEGKYARGLGADHEPRPGLLPQWYWPELPAPFALLLRDLGELVERLSTGTPEDPEQFIALFDGWRGHVQATAERARTRWVEKLPRISSREVTVLAECDLAFRGRTRWLYRRFDVDVRSCWSPREGNDE